ncbi:MAG: tyrosine-type recombinase/integrase [Gammaproteobacteria bacterium]|nr:tyrosine-type recombinase/integrase [Gammaproteobacteria bacterium]NIR84634.1 tyrosine-type recombinase/integrase [Gammaproteobacteria bacterium]NIR90537.1 tyrosine-type recombinase/integrase [Gammaproteobacteria bacterium]NIU05685.1 tyrosine-type recombinase/integrase [Gammaproteobacteria bacterium]NIV52824.1 tyrosine-type recombinase/integrase [Gammaproteobacteria bacterium]
MSELQTTLDEYLAVRRVLGVELALAGRLLQRFVDFAQRQGARFITTQLALEWATQPLEAQPAQWANRLGMVRRFAQYCSAIDPRTEVPPSELLPHRFRRPPPYIYSDEEIARLIQAARQLPPLTGLRPHTYSTLFGLYAVTGMRVNEPLRLNRDDVDLAHAVLSVRGTKFGKSRYVPIHPSTQRVLQRYAARRKRLCPNPQSPSFFLSERGTRVTEWSVRWTFVKLSRQIGLRGPSDSRGPRLHDFRHRFAVKTLLTWYRSGVDVERHLPELATYLGHVHVTDTYWYLTATPELLHRAARRLERGGVR